MRLILNAAAALAALALIVLSSGTSGAAPTAAQVKDDETLKAFVEGAKTYIESLTSVDEILGLKSELRTEGTWKAGPVFVIVFFSSGAPFVHPGDRTAEGKNLLGVEDENGKRVVEDLFATAARGGGFVKYQDGGQKTAYAVEYVSGMTGRRLVLVGG